MSLVLERSGQPSGHAHHFKVPRLLTVGNEQHIPPDKLGEATAHEADHWNFYLNEARYLQQDPKRQLSREEMLADAYKLLGTVKS